MRDKVRVLHSAFGPGNAIMALGLAAGCFSDADLDVAMQEVSRTGLAVSGLMDGAAELAVAGSVPILNSARAGQDPVIVMSLEAHNVFGVIGASGIDVPAKLRGRAVAISGRREQDELMLRRALLEWGIDPDADVALEVLGSRGRCFEAVLSGRAAAMAATIPQPILARSLGLPVLRDYVPEHEPFQLGALVTTRSLAARKPELIARFLAAQLRSIRLFRGDFEAALPHLRARTKIEDVDVLRETHRLFAEQADSYVPDPAALRAVIRCSEAIFGEPIEVDVDRIVDPSFAERLKAS